MTLDERLAKLEEEVALEEKQKKKPYTSMTITTGDPAYNIAQFNKHAGTDFNSPDGANTPTLDSGYMASGSEGEASEGTGGGGGLSEDLLDEDKLFISKHVGGGDDQTVELPTHIKLINQADIEDLIRQISPEDRFEVGYVTPIYFYKELWKQFMLIKCTQFTGYTGIDYRDVRSADKENTQDKIEARKELSKNQMAGNDKHIRSQHVNQDYDQINKTVARHAEKKDDKGNLIHGKLNTILFYPDKTKMPKVTYYIDLHNGKGYRVVARDILEATIFNQIQTALASGKIKEEDLRKKIQKVLDSDYATTGKEVLSDQNKYEYTADEKNNPNKYVMKPQVRALYTNQIYYINVPSLNARIGWPLNENLEEAKRYVRRYYIRPQNIFCSNKDEILKALIDTGNQNCTIYTLNNLGDIKDVHRLTNKDIIYYYDEGILYDKNHVRIMDYDLAIKNEENRKKYPTEPNFKDTNVKNEYEDRMTSVTELEEANELDLDFPELKEEAEHHKCCICGEEFDGFGNNPEPYKSGENDARCCNACNIKFVIPARIAQIQKRDNEEKKN